MTLTDWTVTSDPSKMMKLKGICHDSIGNKPLYQAVQSAVKIPWFVIAALHYRESDQSFTHHLHNGDPLTDRTVHVPSGRPVEGEPPYSWPDSAIDALSNVWMPHEWSIENALEFCERYNGLGYRKHGLKSPYVWSFTDRYSCGLFVADGSMDLTLKDSRPGVAAILKVMAQWGGVSLDFASFNKQNLTLH